MGVTENMPASAQRMLEETGEKEILITDDSGFQRKWMKGILKDLGDYQITEASNGKEALEHIAEAIDAKERGERQLVLMILDIEMPVMDGMEVLKYMQSHNIDDIPVIVSTSLRDSETERNAFKYGADEVLHKPANPNDSPEAKETIITRCNNVMKLYNQKQQVREKLREQEAKIRAQEFQLSGVNSTLLEIIGGVAETRHVESSIHAKHIKYFTRVILEGLMDGFPKYGLDAEDINMIVEASAYHDIGKIAVPDSILLKPSRLTDAEFETVKEHTVIGGQIMDKAFKNKDSKMYKYSYEVCRSHHECWDGSGYPDKLVGDNIPISAQVVGLADVYEALVSPMTYKNSIPKEKAFDMVRKAENRQFSPDVMRAFEAGRQRIMEVAKYIDRQSRLNEESGSIV